MLISPARYFPIERGRYEVKPGMLPLGKCFGNGAVDNWLFQIDNSFASYRQVKLSSRAESLSKYFQTRNYTNFIATAVASVIITHLTQEHPQHFQILDLKDGISTLNCNLTQEKLHFDSNYQLQAVEATVSPPYISTLDALAAQVQEDITVICRRSNGKTFVSAIHLCFPNHWSAEDKIGKDFATVHAPVAGMEKINQKADAITNTMIIHSPMVRFAWGLSTDTHLNHHPEPAPNIQGDIDQGRNFDINNPQMYLRIERQVIWGLPLCDAAIFTIRTYFRDVKTLNHDEISQLISAIESMPHESLIYKGLLESRDGILTWLQNL